MEKSMSLDPLINEQYEWKAVKVEFRDSILEITLNRPERLNSFNEDMRMDFRALQGRIEGDERIRAILISGAGDRAFGAGADVSWFEHEWATPRFRVEYRWVHDFFDCLERVEVPVIAAVHGICACGGLELAMACDFRIAAEDARFGFTEGNINLVPGSGGCSRLVRMIGPGWAKEMVLAGEFFDAAKAERIGLVTRVVAREQLMDEARGLAEKLAAKAPQALGLGKAVINTCMSVDLTSGRVLERVAQSTLIATSDHKEGVQAFREKRKAQFRGR